MELVFPAPLSLQIARTLVVDEADLIRRARNGEVAALDELMNTHRARILNLAFQILRDEARAEDAAQEAFVRAFRGLNGFRGESGFATWLYRVALNVCLEKRRAIRVDETLYDEIPIPSRDADLKFALEWALDQLPEHNRIALVLHEWHGLSYEEIARVCAVPVGTVRSRLHSARARFRQIWLEMERE